MIKKTFYNLPEEKRTRIINAILKEFAHSPKDKVSINRIIKIAGISRGSFYQYFDDKVDLIEVLCTTFFEETYVKAKQVLVASDGNLFEMYIKLFDLFVGMASDSKKKMLLKNLIQSLRSNDDLVSEYLTNRFKGFINNNDVYACVDRKSLKHTEDFDVKCLIEILTQLLKNAIFDFFVVGEDVEKVRHRYIRKIDILKTGAAE